ncbi:MAG TPA: nucleotidyltransferase [Clostridiaceae bacterium]|jgi:predicted nucleotidyltransferase|nr:nucleotidyltransferase [Clostridia bacterium]HJJ13102.1 nucleotidyltransferase [Clostridiaceae bacterium]
MSKVLGIIAEYNPFHNGHLLHLEKSKKICDAQYSVCVMSGNFVQRGNTSIVNKWIRAEMALKSGVDLVLELPTVYSISSAENFAEGAIKLLNSLKIVDTISFGSENSDINVLNRISSVLHEEPKQYLEFLNSESKKGLSFPKARENAILLYLNDKKYLNILNQPNNTLAIEYLKALKKYKSHISPISVKREKVFYNSNCIVDEYASATAIRNMIINEQFNDIRKVVPASSYNLLMNEIEEGHLVIDISKFEKEILYAIRRLSADDIKNFPEVTEGLENAIKNASNSCNNLSELINMIKSKRYTHTRIQRILLYILLNITKKDMYLSRKNIPYARILGYSPQGKELISEIYKANPKITLITSVKNFLDSSNNKTYKYMLNKDILATNIYTLAYKNNSTANLDYTKKIVTL